MAKPILDDELWALIEPLAAPSQDYGAIRYPGPQAARQSCGAHGHPVRLTDRPALGPTSSRDGLRQRHEVAGAACVTGRRQASGTSCTRCCLRGYAQPTKSTGLASSSTPLQSVLWAQVKNGTESHRPRATRFKASPHHRSAGHPARGDTDRRQPQRCDSTPGAGRGYSTHQWQARQAAFEAPYRSGRQRLRPRQISPPAACSRHCHRNRADVASLTAAGWVKHAGSSSEPSRGFITSDGYASASNVLLLSTKPS